MKRVILAWAIGGVACGVGGAVGACSSSSSGSPVASADGSTGDGAVAPVSFAPEIACTDSIASVYGDPGDVSALAKGAIIKCAKDAPLTAAQLTAAVDVANDAGDMAYSGRPFTSGANVYHVLYRTERGDTAGSPGYSSALLLLPQTPRNGDGHPLPAIVAAHGSRGQAAACAPSLDTEAGAYVEEDFQHLVYPLVGLGFPVIAPDLAGYANFGAPGNPPPVYDSAADVGKSMLDGARAIRNVIPSSLTEQVVITGHSQGGYTAFAALALAPTYGADGVIAAVAVYSPLWFTQGAWGAVLLGDTLFPSDYTFTASSAGPVSIWYHYTHSYLLDGPDAALELFDPTKGAIVQSFVNNDCWAPSYPVLLEAGTSPGDQDAGTTANDLFSAAYVSAIAGPASGLGNGNCASSSNQALCNTWISRMAQDYPHLEGGAAKVPVLIWYAKNDTTITPDVMQCVFNRLSSDQANYKVCYDPNPVGHSGVVADDSNYLVDWIAQQTVPDAGAPTEGNCTALGTSDAGAPQLLTADGGIQACNSLLPTAF